MKLEKMLNSLTERTEKSSFFDKSLLEKFPQKYIRLLVENSSIGFFDDFYFEMENLPAEFVGYSTYGHKSDPKNIWWNNTGFYIPDDWIEGTLDEWKYCEEELDIPKGTFVNRFIPIASDLCEMYLGFERTSGSIWVLIPNLSAMCKISDSIDHFFENTIYISEEDMDTLTRTDNAFPLDRNAYSQLYDDILRKAKLIDEAM